MTREEAAKRIREDMRLHHDYLSGEYRKALNMSVEALEQPELIRCKDCKWWDCSPSSTIAPTFHKCRGFDYHYTEASEYCSRAERKEDG